MNTATTTRPRFDAEAIRARLPMLELLEREGVVMKRHGTLWQGCCPFHVERSGSFTVTPSRAVDRAHCFGCGWDGDIFKFWMERRGVDFPRALEELASLCGVGPVLEGVEFVKREVKKREVRSEERGPVALPPMRHLTRAEVEMIAHKRGLFHLALKAAAWNEKRIGFARWPLWRRRSGEWASICEVHGFKCSMQGPECRARELFDSWVITDATRRVAEFRRLDNEKYPRVKHEPIKAWSTAGKSWPVGCAEIGERKNVLLVEGGPDVLAGYHFLFKNIMLDQVAVVGMLGGSNRMAEDALPYFRGKRVRLVPHADALRTRETAEGVVESRAGYDAALKWQECLVAAGAAAVTAFSLEGLTQADGSAVNDLNDLARCAPEVLEDREIRAAFIDWRF